MPAAIAPGQNVPLVLRGDASVASWSPPRLPQADDDTLERLADLYASDALLGARLEEALQARAIAADMGGRGADARGADARRGRGGANPLGALTAAAGRFLTADGGPRIAVLEAGGWDTHANQGAAQGALAARLAALDAGFASLRAELGAHWQRTVVVVATEFGRTVAVNGTRGTDHGTGGCAFVAGGAVRGGRVVGDWPGLAAKDLHEGRDLKPTTDLRAVLKGVLHEHMGLTERVLEQEIFPDSAGARPFEGLVVPG